MKTLILMLMAMGLTTTAAMAEDSTLKGSGSVGVQVQVADGAVRGGVRGGVDGAMVNPHGVLLDLQLKGQAVAGEGGVDADGALKLRLGRMAAQCGFGGWYVGELGARIRPGSGGDDQKNAVEGGAGLKLGAGAGYACDFGRTLILTGVEAVGAADIAANGGDLAVGGRAIAEIQNLSRSGYGVMARGEAERLASLRDEVRDTLSAEGALYLKKVYVGAEVSTTTIKPDLGGGPAGSDTVRDNRVMFAVGGTF